MKIFRYFFMLVLLAALFSGCSIDLNQPTPTHAGENAHSAVTSLGLRGKLIYTIAQQAGSESFMEIHLLDLSTGAVTVLFHTTSFGVIYSVTVSPDAKQIIFSYSLPPGADQAIQQKLYQMPLDGSKQPELFLQPASPDDQYLQPEWSPDGKFIYFVHANYQRPPQKGQQYPLYEIYRITYPSGQPEKLVDGAYWPRLAPDMSRLAYITLNIITGKNILFLANVDGTNPIEIPLTGNVPLDILDAPLFSPDGTSIFFSVPVSQESYAPPTSTWVEKLLGVTVASAHAVPSEWWTASRKGGTATQLTQIQAIGLFGSVSPDKKMIASYSGAGIFVMNLDGSGLTMLVKDTGGMPGTVSWIP